LSSSFSLFFALIYLISSSRFNLVIISLYLFLIVTSVTPETSDMSLCVLLSPSKSPAIYRAAAAIPIGPLPEVSSNESACDKISIPLDCVSGL
jgi:hypothetical protein